MKTGHNIKFGGTSLLDSIYGYLDSVLTESIQIRMHNNLLKRDLIIKKSSIINSCSTENSTSVKFEIGKYFIHSWAKYLVNYANF